MTFRDVLAALLIAAGVGSLSGSAFLISPAAGFGVLGALLLLVGVALGVGEIGVHHPVPETDEAALVTALHGSETVTGTLGPARIQHKGEQDGGSGDGNGDAPTPPPAVAKTIPISSYIGVRGHLETEPGKQ